MAEEEGLRNGECEQVVRMTGGNLSPRWRHAGLEDQGVLGELLFCYGCPKGTRRVQGHGW